MTNKGKANKCKYYNGAEQLNLCFKNIKSDKCKFSSSHILHAGNLIVRQQITLLLLQGTVDTKVLFRLSHH